MTRVGASQAFFNIVASFNANKLIKDGSLLNLCGYKRTHPLENRILFTMSMNNTDGLEEEEKRNSIIQVFKDCCQELIGIYGIIIKSI